MAQQENIQMASISLSKAMKVKNRLAGRLAKVQLNICAYNSVLQGQAGEVNINELDKERGEIVECLICLKTAISISSRGIQEMIYRLAEKKAEIEFLNGLNTKNGTEPAYGLRSADQVFVATIQMKHVAERVKRLEGEIDELQDKMDSYNSVPERVNISARTLELAS